MRRRGVHDQVASLFSFQDVMASVIGVLFFVVLLMSLSIVHEKAPVAKGTPDVPGAAQVQDLRAALQRLATEAQGLEGGIERTTTWVAGLQSGNLDRLQEETGKLRILVDNLKGRIGAAGGDLAGAQQALQKAQQALADAQRKPDTPPPPPPPTETQKDSKMPHVVYKVGRDPSGLRPLLVELSAGSLRAAPLENVRAVTSFPGPSAGQRNAEFLAWASKYDKKTHYFVLVIKPSATRLADKIADELDKAGFEIGRDLLPEDWDPF